MCLSLVVRGRGMLSVNLGVSDSKNFGLTAESLSFGFLFFDSMAMVVVDVLPYRIFV